ncbi:MAG: hypothetical protein KDD51_06615 [Bdellovibrionales bacterium]|nr:hypothetical protein [Bdellovibrionales bacterium]
MRAFSWMLLGLGCLLALAAKAETDSNPAAPPTVVVVPSEPARGAEPAPGPSTAVILDERLEKKIDLPEPLSPFEKPKQKVTPRGEIVFVERRVPASAQDKPSKEYYLNIGKFDDVAVGDVFHVFRDVAVVDVTLGEPLEFIPVKFAEIQITFAGESTSVGRLLGMVDPRSLPKLDYAVIMVGDRVKRKVGLPFASNS